MLMVRFGGLSHVNFFRKPALDDSANAPKVLSVGQCGFDHRAIAGVFKSRLGAKVVHAGSFAEAAKALALESYQLVLMNRILDSDGTSGLEWIRRLKADPALAETPLMLVSNYPDAQSQAEELGALPGFGKSNLHSDALMQRLKHVLNPVGETPRLSESKEGDRE